MAVEKRPSGGLYDRCICDDRGFTTIGMAIALLLSVSLLLSSAQVYRINSAAAEIQDVADAAALAAQNEVAEFVTVVRVCDALILSMSLLGVATYGAGIVAMCAPATAQLSVKLVEFGKKVFEARDDFAKTAASNLNRIQRALPFFAVLSASRVAAANNDSGALPARYCAVAILLPLEGKEIKLAGLDANKGLEQSVDQKAEGIENAAAEMEDLALQAAEVKHRAFEADCGAFPDGCMYERASKLAGLTSTANPLFQSADAWSFSVALDRARAYYGERYAQERPSGSVKEQANSALRKMYYGYAVEQLSSAYVVDAEDSFSAYLPLLPASTAEMRLSPLYDKAAFPVSGSGDSAVAHAWSGCPGAGSSSYLASARQIEASSFGFCSQCEFSVASLGNVAAASSSISNGFEFHYRIVAAAAEEYEGLRAGLDPVARKTKQELGGLLQQCAEVAKQLKDVRLKASPPGSAGVVAMVVNLEQKSIGFGSGLVGEATLGTRVAVAGATLLEEPATAEGSVLSSLLDGFAQDGSAAIGAGRSVLNGWSRLLETYGSGQEGLSSSIEAVLEPVPIVGGSGLSDWAVKKFKESMKSVGLQPADLDSPKPVLVNTSLVASKSSDSFATRYRSAQSLALSASSPATDSFSVLLAGLESQAHGLVDSAESKGFEIARIELPVGDTSIPVTIDLPAELGEQAHGVIDSSIAAVASAYAESSGVRSWE